MPLSAPPSDGHGVVGDRSDDDPARGRQVLTTVSPASQPLPAFATGQGVLDGNPIDTHDDAASTAPGRPARRSDSTHAGPSWPDGVGRCLWFIHPVRCRLSTLPRTPRAWHRGPTAPIRLVPTTPSTRPPQPPQPAGGPSGSPRSTTGVLDRDPIILATRGEFTHEGLQTSFVVPYRTVNTGVITQPPPRLINAVHNALRELEALLPPEQR